MIATPTNVAASLDLLICASSLGRFLRSKGMLFSRGVEDNYEANKQAVCLLTGASAVQQRAALQPLSQSVV